MKDRVKVAYIAGAMTGMPELNHPAFFAMADKLEKNGFGSLNPASLPLGMREDQYMDICVAMVRNADYVVMLDGWQKSAGALAEYALASKLGKTIYDEDLKILIPVMKIY